MNLTFDPMEVASMLGMAAAWVMLLMFSLWGAATILRNAGLAGIGWAFGLVSLSAIYFVHTDGYVPRQLMMFIMAVVWGCRLSFVLLWRMVKDHKEDPRSRKMRKGPEAQQHLKLLVFFQLQGLFSFILSVPFLVMALNPRPGISWIEWLGFGIWMAAVAGETIADDQLRVFKLNPANRGRVCNVGLWNYSRHPNYFFEWLVWVSFFVAALGSPFGWTAIICPTLMLYFLLAVSGVPPTEEQSLQSRGEAYREYQRTTSMFIPLPKKLGRA